MLLVGALRSPGVTRLRRYYDPVRLPTLARAELWIPHHAVEHDLAQAGAPKFLNLSLNARRPLPPRRVERLHVPVPSSLVLASPFSGRLATLIFAFRGRTGFACATAHTVRLPRLRRRDYSRSTLGRLHVPQALHMVTSFRSQERLGFTWHTRERRVRIHVVMGSSARLRGLRGKKGSARVCGPPPDAPRIPETPAQAFFGLF
jgi:hypothetical protein